MNANDLFHKVSTLHGNIANDAFQNGGTLTCSKCGTVWKVNKSDCAHYLRNGWPMCHGLTMTYSAAATKAVSAKGEKER